MRRYILTGAPGSGKTSIVRALDSRGRAVVQEAATDVIADASRRGVDRHWEQPSFIDQILAVQRERQAAPAPPGSVEQFYDRSPICTLALAEYLGHPVSATLTAEIDRIRREFFYRQKVFLVRDLGFVEKTDARRSSFEESREFERVHVTTYETLGYELIDVPRGTVADRADLIERAVRAWT